MCEGRKSVFMCVCVCLVAVKVHDGLCSYNID